MGDKKHANSSRKSMVPSGVSMPMNVFVVALESLKENRAQGNREKQNCFKNNNYRVSNHQ